MVPDDGWHEVPGMAMLSVGMPSGLPLVTPVTGALPGTGLLVARHYRKERP